jgi:hypothetical protein
MSWSECETGGGGTTQVVAKEDTGVPEVFCQVAKVIQPVPNGGASTG